MAAFETICFIIKKASKQEDASESCDTPRAVLIMFSFIRAKTVKTVDSSARAVQALPVVLKLIMRKTSVLKVCFNQREGHVFFSIVPG